MHTHTTRAVHVHMPRAPCTCACHAYAVRMRMRMPCRLRDEAAGRVPRAARAGGLATLRRPMGAVEQVVGPRPADLLNARADVVDPP